MKNIILKTITALAAFGCFWCCLGVIETGHPIACTVGALVTGAWCLLFAAVNGGLA